MHRLVGGPILGEDLLVAMQSGLATKVLKDVSRSFYLSLRFLPPGFRSPASLGYLLARLSDTIADAGGASPEDRKSLLAEFRDSMESGKRDWLGGLDRLTGLSEGEERLVVRANECLDAIVELPEWQQNSVRKVVGIITEGQSWDLVRFEGDGLVRLDGDEELRRYTYQVAGCVGEFWTELGLGCDEDFASESEVQMLEWGRDFGRSLQLINILRDVAEDLENGRCYLPGEGRPEKEELMVLRGKWIEEASAGLDSAEKYARALHGKRMRFATILPSRIGRRTLELLEGANWEEWQGRLKVSRSEVRKMMFGAMKFAIWE